MFGGIVPTKITLFQDIVTCWISPVPTKVNSFKRLSFVEYQQCRQRLHSFKTLSLVGYQQAISYFIIGFRKKCCSSHFFIKHPSLRIYSFFFGSHFKCTVLVIQGSTTMSIFCKKFGNLFAYPLQFNFYFLDM